MRAFIFDALVNAYKEKVRNIGDEQMKNLEKVYALQAIDGLWMDHLDTMDHLRDSVRLRAYGQRDPLVEYKNEAVRLFRDLQNTIRSAIVAAIFRIGAESRQPAVSKPIMMNFSNQQASKQKGSEVGRNDPCPCGAIDPTTNKIYKYKKCGLINAPHHKA